MTINWQKILIIIMGIIIGINACMQFLQTNLRAQIDPVILEVEKQINEI